eukprot:Gb_40221 [translate_table: standard]
MLQSHDFVKKEEQHSNDFIEEEMFNFSYPERTQNLSSYEYLSPCTSTKREADSQELASIEEVLHYLNYDYPTRTEELLCTEECPPPTIAVTTPSATYVDIYMRIKERWKSLRAMIDTGATINLCPYSLIKGKWIPIKPVSILSFSNSHELSKIAPEEEIMIGHSKLVIPFFASPLENGPVILSMPFLDSIGPITICHESVHYFPGNKLSILPRIDPYKSSRCQCHTNLMICNNQRKNGPSKIKEQEFIRRPNDHGKTSKPVFKLVRGLIPECYDSGGNLFSSKKLMALYRKDSFIKHLTQMYQIELQNVWQHSSVLMQRLLNQFGQAYESLLEENNEEETELENDMW